MLKEIRPALIILVGLTLITGLAYPLAITGIAGTILPVSGTGQPDQEGRQDDRLGPDRAGVQGRQVFPWPSVGDDDGGPCGFDQDRSCAVQRGEFFRLESWSDQQGAQRPHERGCRQAESREPVDAGPGRSGHDHGQRPRSPHLAGSRAVSGPRVATARKLPEDAVRKLVNDNVEGRFAGLLGEPRVNVLALNLALDRATK